VIRRVLAVAILFLAPAPTPALAAQVPQSEYAARRAALVARMPDAVLLALGAREPSKDYLTFHQSPDFQYLTGYREPDAALVMVKRSGQTTGWIFVQPREPAREVWTGRRNGSEGATRLTGLTARPIGSLTATLDSLIGSGLPLVVVGEMGGDFMSADAQFVERLRRRHTQLQVTDASAAVRQLRGTKSAAELALLRKAAEITVLAHQEAMRAIEPGMNEFEIQSLIEYTFRRNGADRPGFATIVGSGPNSTILHYNADDRFMQTGEVVVMDIGALYRGYSADVTRTVPVNGRFTPEQRAIYQIVRDAQAAAERQAKVGGATQAMDDSSRAVLAAGLARLGLIESPNAAFDAVEGTCVQPVQGGCSQLSLYYMHSLGHGIGLEVHDPDQYYGGRIQPGSAFTLEPGIYVGADVLDHLLDTPRNRALIAKLRPAVQRYANIGVRIEDDYLVTDRGVEWVSRAPREIEEIEALMQERYAGPAARKPEVVEWYKETARQR
jgi:Xaa-Pro aminopeptidase